MPLAAPVTTTTLSWICIQPTNIQSLAVPKKPITKPHSKAELPWESDSPKAIREMLPRMAFNSLLGIRLHETHDDGVTISCRVKPKLLNLAGVLHGGVSATLADAAVGIATTRHYKGRPITTVELKINYFRPIPLESTVYARARLVRTGSTLSIGQVELRDSEQNLCGIAIVTYILLEMRGTK
jgi:uncharacterized protein (TIGR00369 family)